MFIITPRSHIVTNFVHELSVCSDVKTGGISEASFYNGGVGPVSVRNISTAIFGRILDNMIYLVFYDRFRVTYEYMCGNLLR